MPQCEIQFGGLDRQGKRVPGAPGLFMKGPLIPVEVRLPSQLAAAFAKGNRLIPKPQIGLALIDTGATKSSVDKSVITSLALPETGRTKLRHASGEVDTTLRAIEMAFPTIGNALVMLPQAISCDLGGMEFNNQRVIVLFGRDLLSRFVMIYNGPRGRVTLITS